MLLEAREEIFRNQRQENQEISTIWLDKLQSALQKRRVSFGGHYSRDFARSDLKFYRLHASKRSSLLVAFGGMGRRLMMPPFHIMSFLERNRRDLLLVTAPRPGTYGSGFGSFGSDFSTSLQKLVQFVEEKNYPRVDVLGISAGCLPALLAAPRLSARTVTLAGPSNPARPRSLISPDAIEASWGVEREASSPPRPRHQPHVTVTVGANKEVDIRAMNVLRDLVPITEIVVPGAEHNCLWPMVQVKAFDSWLSYCLSPTPRRFKRLERALQAGGLSR